jgi:hypothetical protein
MKNVLLTIILFSLYCGQILPQEFTNILPEGLSLSNQLEYSYDIENKQEIFENWLNLDYRKNIFSAGVRLDIFQPNDPSPSINRGKVKFAGIDFKYIKAEIGELETGLDITAGNFYSLFGRGLILKSYEERNIRIDNNLLGLKLEGRFAGFHLTALTGSAENSNSERKDILHAIDLEYNDLNWLKLGSSFASNDPAIDGVARTMFSSLRGSASIWNFDLYSELGIKQNADIKEKIFNGTEKIAGKAFYGNINFYYSSLSLSGEYKIYDNFGFKSEDQTIDYNTPPALKKEYTYILLNRHPSPLNSNNEEGFQFEIIYNFSDETYITGNYGLTKTLTPNSYYQRINNFSLPRQVQLKEGYIQLYHNWNEQLTTIASFGYNEERDANTKNITPILEARYYFQEINTIRFIAEHQNTTNRTTLEQYYTDVLTIEYQRSPLFSVSFITEMRTNEPEEGKIIRRFWNFIQFGYKLGEHTNLTLLFGSRQAGNICIGGVCRYEPEFSGIEFKMFTRL